MEKNILIVKEPEEMILMKGEFSEGALKLSAYLIANLEKDVVHYKINIKDYLDKYDKSIGDYNYLYKIAKELSNKQFEMIDRINKKFSIWNFVSNVDYFDGVLEIYFSLKTLNYLMEIKDKYIKYDLLNIMRLDSKYLIKLYKFLKDNFEKNTRYGNKSKKLIKVSKLREILEIPNSYQYSSGIKRRVLEKARKEFVEHTDIIFDYEEKKRGRKIDELIFYIAQNPKTMITKTDKNYFKNRQIFVTLLRKNYTGNEKMWGWVTFSEEGKKVNYYLGLDNKGYVYAYAPRYPNKSFDKVESAKNYDLWLKIAQYSEIYQEILLKGLCVLELTRNNDERYIKLNNDLKEFFKKESDKKENTEKLKKNKKY